MVIDDGLLRQAREAASRMADATHHAELAKADYHHAIRRLHYAGASMREIADELEISHQRVHQIIEATGGSGGWKTGRKPKGQLRCSFCGLSNKEVAKLIAGPGVYICDTCVALVRRVIDQEAGVDTRRGHIGPVPDTSRLHCSFCGKPATSTGPMAAGPDLFICGACVQLCEEIMVASEQ